MNDQRLARKAKRGDAEAFVTLAKRHEASLYKVGRAYFRNEHDIADALQETMLSAWSHIAGLRHPRYFKTWLTRIMINSCNAVRSSRRACPATGEELEAAAMKGDGGIAGGMEECDSAMAFDELLSMLPEQYRIVFVLYYGEGYNSSEVAGLLGMSEGTVRSWLSRGRAELRGRLDVDGYNRYVGESSRGSVGGRSPDASKTLFSASPVPNSAMNA